MNSDIYVWVVIAATFVSVSLVILALGVAFDRRRQIVMRLQQHSAPSGQQLDIGSLASNVSKRLGTTFSGWGDPSSNSKLRMELVQAGFFSSEAPALYIAAQIILPLVTALLTYMGLKAVSENLTSGSLTATLLATAFAGYKGPEAFLSRRKESLGAAYRAAFPDFLDLLLVCIDAGLSMNAAIDRVSKEFQFGCKPLATNLSIMLSEIRSGRAFPDALENLSARLGIDEARSFTTLVKQSLELGSDVGGALRVYADEMRTKRLLRAELKANALPIKMLLPLGGFVFPALLIVVLTPAMMSLSAIFSNLVRR